MDTSTHSSPTRTLYERIRRDFDRSGLMTHLGAQLGEVAEGQVCIRLPYSEHVTQHLGYFHAGATTTIADAAGGFAAMTLLSEAQTVLSVEFKINLLAPAQGDALEAVGRIVRPGRTLSVAQIDVYALKGSQRKAVALMQQTLINLPQPA
ncbi:putative protein (TIGR00369 family) OS=Castellaniella defragrans OX=75697 GN=HNR28_001558 PE=3 SV=1 [Castellaniella defragrans]